MDRPWKLATAILFAGIFWLWNGVFLLLAYGLLLPFWAPQLLGAIAGGDVAAVYLIPLGLLLVVPPTAVVVGLVKFCGQPRSLLRLFYGVEAPLMVLAGTWIFLLREVTPGATWTLATAVLCVGFYGLELMGYRPGRRDRGGAIAVLVTSGLMLALAIGVGALLTLYAVPLTWTLLVSLGQSGWFFGGSLFEWATGVLTLLFVLTSTVLMAGMPVSVSILYWRSGLRGLEGSARRWGQRRMFWGAIAALGFWVMVLAGLSHQPQHFAFRTLDRPITTDRDRQTLIDQGDRLRRGLVNAYLQRQRYLSTTTTSRDVADLYRLAFDMPDGPAQTLQQIRDRLIFPFLYQGQPGDAKRASRLYGSLFDVTLERGEQAALQRAFRASVTLDGAAAGALNVNEERVLLERQELEVTPHGDWATVALHEVYRNQTLEVEEVLYQFSLPESAVVTGLWLGDTEDLAKRFAYRISPRGAAQAVYESQVQRAAPVDPALLEQVGPQQYRLRAFPVPPRPASWQTTPTGPTVMHLWLTLEVPRQGDRYPLPTLLERRNIYWTAGRTERRYGDGVAAAGRSPEAVTDRTGQPETPWLPTAIAVPETIAAQAPQRQTYGAIAGYRVTADPLPRDRLPLPTAPRLAVILDTSYSMDRQRAALNRLWRWFGQRGYLDQRLDNGDVDLFLPGDALSDRAPQWQPAAERFRPDRYVFFGSVPPQRAFEQYQTLQRAQPPSAPPYDAVIFVTDRGTYELAGDRNEPVTFDEPLWLLHVGGQLPEAYDDATLTSFQDSGGGIATDIQTLLGQLALRQTAQGAAPERIPFTWADGYRWRFDAIAASSAPSDPSDPSANQASSEIQGDLRGDPRGDRLLAAPAARQLIQYLAGRTASPTPETLDRIHRIATDFGIVTPYSSAIVLVNDDQRRALDQAEASRDRFNRKGMTGQENSDPNAASIPETSPLYGLPLVLLLLWATRSRSSHHAATSTPPRGTTPQR